MNPTGADSWKRSRKEFGGLWGRANYFAPLTKTRPSGNVSKRSIAFPVVPILISVIVSWITLDPLAPFHPFDSHRARPDKFPHIDALDRTMGIKRDPLAPNPCIDKATIDDTEVIENMTVPEDDRHLGPRQDVQPQIRLPEVIVGDEREVAVAQAEIEIRGDPAIAEHQSDPGLESSPGGNGAQPQYPSACRQQTHAGPHV